MITRQRSDVSVNIPALKKLDAMLMVRNFPKTITNYGIKENSKTNMLYVFFGCVNE